ncbi:MAG TPA: GNAT family N-acetyltransferase [Steroidobacteraceae bacterium]|nr:GNAT family N-acetyltransferase [Steroidobacteraceae bacterium]
MKATVRDNSAQQRFELAVGDALAIINYRREGRFVGMTHVEVPVDLRGKGVGSTLVAGALALVRQRGEKVAPLCSFVVRYIRWHPENEDLLADGYD